MTYGEIKRKLKEIGDIQEKIELIKQNLGSLGMFGIVDLVEKMSPSDKKQILDAFRFRLNPFCIVELAKGMDVEARKEIILEYINIFDSSEILQLTNGMDNITKLEILDEISDRIIPTGIIKAYTEMSVDVRKEIIKKYINKLNSHSILELTANMDDSNIMNIIEENEDKIDISCIEMLAQRLNIEFKKQILMKYEEKLPVNDMLNLVKSMDLESKKYIIDKYIDMIPIRDLVILVKDFDVEYKKGILERFKNKFDGIYLVDLVRDFDAKSRKNIISKYKSIIGSYGIVSLIYDMNYQDKIATMKENEDFLSIIDIAKLIKSMEYEYQKQAMAMFRGKLSSMSIVEIAKDMDEVAKIGIISDYKDIMMPYDVLELTNGMSNKAKKEVLKSCKNDFAIVDIVELAQGMDVETRKQIISEFADKMASYDIVILAKNMTNMDRMEIVRKYANKLHSFGIAILIKDTKLIKDILGISNSASKFSLPNDMTVGMEIESEGSDCLSILNSFDFQGWNAKEDGSLVDGVEVVSPILHPDSKSMDEIFIVTKMLKDSNQNVSGRCGGHIHIGANYLTSRESYVNLFEIWCNTEKILYLICNAKNELPRANVKRFAKTIAPNVEVALKKGSITLNNDDDLECFVDSLQQIQKGGRYYGLNLSNINYDKNTIEFRVANGTLNPELWIDNINLFGGIVTVSEELAKIQQKENISEAEKEKLERFDKLKECVVDEEKLKILLDMIGLPKEHYIPKFQVNMQLMNNIHEDSNDINEMFDKTEGPINLKKRLTSKDIAKMTINVSASSQQEAMENLTKEMNKKKNYTLERE